MNDDRDADLPLCPPPRPPLPVLQWLSAGHPVTRYEGCGVNPDPLRPSDTDEITAEPYQPEPPINWRFLLAAVVVSLLLWAGAIWVFTRFGS